MSSSADNLSSIDHKDPRNLDGRVVRLEVQMSQVKEDVTRLVEDVVSIKDKLGHTPTKDDIRELKSEILDAVRAKDEKDTSYHDLIKLIIVSLFKALTLTTVALIVLAGVRGITEIWPGLFGG